MIEPVAELIEQVVAADPQQRPGMNTIVHRLLGLEIETLREHIGTHLSSRAVAA